MTVLRLRTDGLIWLETEGEIVALDTEASTYLSGNRTAAAVWETLAAGATRSDLVETLLARFDVDRETAEADVDTFVGDLKTRNLLEES